MFLDIFNRNRQKGKVTVTSINLKFMGEMHSISGREVKGGIFELSIPFQNKIGNDLLPDMLKGPKLTVNKIEVSPPFQLLDFTPRLPAEVDYMNKIVFKLRIKAPDMTYEGPMSINFGNESKEQVNLNVSKMTLTAKGVKTDVDDSAMIISMQKGQIFKRSIQMYKVFSYMDTVNGIEVTRPFEFVSSDPKFPMVLDRKDSYIIDIYLKAPDYNYAGTLDIKFD